MKNHRYIMAWLLLTMSLLITSGLFGQVVTSPGTSKPLSEQFRLMPVPSSLTAAGKPGDMAIDADTNELYVYTGNGRAPHSWVVVSGGGLTGNLDSLTFLSQEILTFPTPGDADTAALFYNSGDNQFFFKNATGNSDYLVPGTIFETELANKRDLAASTNAQTGTSYTFQVSDVGRIVTMTNGSANTATIPLNDTAAIPVGSSITIQQGGAGATTIAATGGVTLTKRSGTSVIGAAGHYANLLKTGTDTWELTVEPLDRSTTTNPAVTDDADDGYQVGAIWRNTSTGNVFYLVDNTASAAVWVQFNPVATQTGTHSSPDTSGGAVSWAGPVHIVWTNTTSTYTLPAVASYAGRSVGFYVTGTNAITIDPNASEVIVRDGTAQTGGVTLTLTGAAGNYVFLFSTGTRWVTFGYKGTLAAGS